jgi:hypothetical protein
MVMNSGGETRDRGDSKAFLESFPLPSSLLLSLIQDFGTSSKETAIETPAIDQLDFLTND